MHAGKLMLFFGLTVFLSNVRKLDASGAFVTPGLPACYLSLSSSQEVSGLYELCSAYGSCSTGGLQYYTYCSNDHHCCLVNGCAGCCTNRDYFYQGEVAGIVIGCIGFTALVFGFAIFISNKFCSKVNVS